MRAESPRGGGGELFVRRGIAGSGGRVGSLPSEKFSLGQKQGGGNLRGAVKGLALCPGSPPPQECHRATALPGRLWSGRLRSERLGQEGWWEVVSGSFRQVVV